MAKKQKDPNKKSIWQEFKEFISRGNVLDMAVGVVIGGAFSAIVTAVVNILMSVCTWGVPGGIAGLVTVLPAATAAQQGIAGIGQSFASADLADMTIAYASSQGATITVNDASFITWQNALKGLYDLHGATYTYCKSAIIDWGTLINAVISFLIVAATLFVIVKVAAKMNKAREDMKAKVEAKKAAKAAEAAPADDAQAE